MSYLERVEQEQGSATAAADAEKQVGAGQPPRAVPQTRGTILVVENEENSRHLMEHILRFAGYRCVLATNGQEALDILDHEQMDLVLLDLSMPIMDGYQATELIRARPQYEMLPIVAVTAFAPSDDRGLALRSGCTAYLSKPFRPRDLLGMVERLLGGASASI